MMAFIDVSLAVLDDLHVRRLEVGGHFRLDAQFGESVLEGVGLQGWLKGLVGYQAEVAILVIILFQEVVFQITLRKIQNEAFLLRLSCLLFWRLLFLKQLHFLNTGSQIGPHSLLDND